MLPVEPMLFLTCLLIVAIAAVVQGAIGMGFGQVSAAGLVWIAPNMLPTSIILMALVVGAIGAMRELPNVQVKMLSTALVGRVIGASLSIPMLIWATDHNNGFMLLFGILILVSVGLSLIPSQSRRADTTLSTTALLAGGTASGVMGTITSVGAPPMGLLFQNQLATRARPTLNAFFAIGSIFSLTALWVAGRMTIEHVVFAAYLIPGFVTGAYLSKHLHDYIDHRFRYIMLSLTALSAIALIIKALS